MCPSSGHGGLQAQTRSSQSLCCSVLHRGCSMASITNSAALNIKRQQDLRGAGEALRTTRYRTALMVLILLAGLHSASGDALGALTFPTDDNTFVIDAADALSAAEESNLEQLSVDLEAAWGTEIVIVVIGSVAAYASDGDENVTGRYYTLKLFDRWDVGDQLWKDGILLVLATNQSGSWDWWFEMGLFWDDTQAFGNIGAAADSHFDAGNWSDGLEIVLSDLVEGAESYWIENDGFLSPPSSGGDADGMGSIVAAIFCLAIGLGGMIAVAVLFRGGTITSGPGHHDGPGVYRPWFRRRYWGGSGVDSHHGMHHDGHHDRLDSGSFQSRRSSRSSSRSSRSRGSSSGGNSSRSSRSSGSGGRRGGGRRGSR